MHNFWENTQKITFSVATTAVIVRSLWALSLNFFSTKYAWFQPNILKNRRQKKTGCLLGGCDEFSTDIRAVKVNVSAVLKCMVFTDNKLIQKRSKTP